MKLRHLFAVARSLLTVALLAGGAWYAWRNSADLLLLSRVEPLNFLLIIAGLGAVFVATGYTFFLLIRAVGVELDVQEWVGLSFVANALNYLIPVRPGIIAKATYLKATATLPYARFSSVLLAKAVIFVGTTALLGIAMLIWLQPSGQGALLLAGLCGVLVFIALVPLFIPLIRFQREGRIFQILDNAVYGFEEIRTQRGRTVLIAGSILIQHLASALVCLAAFGALGFEINLPISLVLVAFASIANVLSITPNNIGIQELVIAYTYTIVGLDFQEGLLGAALIRAGHVVLTFLVAPWFTYRLLSARNLRLSRVLTDRRRILAPGREGR